jgi:hypothetical protein
MLEVEDDATQRRVDAHQPMQQVASHPAHVYRRVDARRVDDARRLPREWPAIVYQQTTPEDPGRTIVVCGKTPGTQVAARALRSTDRTVAVIAADLGYTSESAFSTTFKRLVGVAPSIYRPPLGQPIESMSTNR